MSHDDDRPVRWPPGPKGTNPDYWKVRNDAQPQDGPSKPPIKGIETPEQRRRRLEQERDPSNWDYDKLAGSFASAKATDESLEAVGYGKPPKKTRFKPGMSGNPFGRPKKTLNLSNQLVVLMSKTVKINDKASGREKKMSNAEIISHQLVAKAKQGDIKAIDKIYKELKDHPAMALPHNVDAEASREKREGIDKLLKHMEDVSKRAYRYRDIERLVPDQDPVELLRYMPEVQDAQYRQHRGLPSRKKGDELLIPADLIKKPGEPLD